MSREKQIEEMARTSCAIFAEGGLCEQCEFRETGCAERDVARHMYAKGYRKASDVAAEIFAEIGKHIVFNTYGIATISEKTFAELKKKYAESEGAQ